ncbi:MAG TPA: M20 family metallopeptidase [Nocardioidaceae bacterium]|nr:M20 family metallopeptidase [Nocardioidaceae bacterium]
MPTTTSDDLMGAARGVLGDVVALRRDLHRHPELGLELTRTQAAVLDAIAPLPLDVSQGSSLTSVVADLRGAVDGPVVLLRADMDALPMPEDTGLAFASEIAGTMHACGHDAHTAMLVGAARVLADRRDQLDGTVRFMFQPGEEGFHGARSMIEEGVLENPPVDVAFALHVTPNLPAGMVGTRPGPILASADVIQIRVTGRGGHASLPHLAADPIPVAAEIVTALQSFVTRRIDPFDPAVVTITKIRAGTTDNVIPEHVDLTGTLRAISDATRRRALAGIERVATGIAAAHEMAAEVRVTPGYPPTVNGLDPVALVERVVRATLGERCYVEMPSPLMGAEDFSYVLAQRPGALAFLGVCPPDTDAASAPACHSNRMTIDEDAMAAGVATYAALAIEALTTA